MSLQCKRDIRVQLAEQYKLHTNITFNVTFALHHLYILPLIYTATYMLHKPDFSPLCHIRVQLIQYKLQKVKKNIKYFPKEYTEVQQIIYTEQQENKPNIKSVGVLSTKSVRAVLFSGQCNVWMVCPKSSLLVNEKMFLA